MNAALAAQYAIASNLGNSTTFNNIAITGTQTFTGNFITSGATYVTPTIITETSSPYSIANNVSDIFVNSVCGAITIHLPSISSSVDDQGNFRVINIMDYKGHAGTNNVTITAHCSDTINGGDTGGSITMSIAYESVKMYATSSGWYYVILLSSYTV